MPVFYGWIVVACAACSSFARQGAAVATLSVFVTPMVMEFGWSRGELSGAVSVGGLLGAIVAPMFGQLVDRAGARLLLVVSAVVVSLCAFALSGIEGLAGFYLCFGLARMCFAGPFDIGIYTAVANWFVRSRARAMSYVGVTAAGALAIMPLLAEFAIGAGGWRAGWIAVGVAVALVGVLPVAWFMRRRPEDLGLVPDGGPTLGGAHASSVAMEPGFTRAQAVRTRAFWLLMLYTGLAFCIQAGISLHQAPLLVEQGISTTLAAAVVSTFSLSAGLGAYLSGRLAERFALSTLLAAVALQLAIAAMFMREVDSAPSGFLAAFIFGTGIGGLLTLPQVAFADYFGRAHFGAIRALALPVQVVGQAAGPLVAGVLYDVTGSYQTPMLVFATLGGLAALAGALARPPAEPVASKP